MTEEELEGVWIVDPVKGNRLASLRYHFTMHGAEVGAENIDQYLRQAMAFARGRRGRGRPVRGETPGVKRWDKADLYITRYVDVTTAGEIVSFGCVQT